MDNGKCRLCGAELKSIEEEMDIFEHTVNNELYVDFEEGAEDGDIIVEIYVPKYYKNFRVCGKCTAWNKYIRPHLGMPSAYIPDYYEEDE